ncbi:MAG TPA: MATE family efflux transporter, partial [Longimicrobiales bacterium]
MAAGRAWPAESWRSWPGLLWAAVRGRGGDPTSGPVARAVVLLAVPMVLEQVMESVFAIVDIAFVSRLGAAATAAVGLTESVLTMVYTVAWGLSIGVTSMVARRIGEGDADGAAEAAVQAIVLGLITSAVLGVAGGLSARWLLGLMGGDASVARVGAGFATVMMAGNGAIMMLYLLNAAFRGAGDAAIAMRVLWLANGINLVLDPCLIFGLGPFPRMGVTGAAVATTTGRGIAVVAQLITLFLSDGRLRVRARHLRLRGGVMLRMLRLSGTGAVQVFIGQASWIALMRLIAGFGSVAVAGFTIAIRIVIFALLPAAGVANAAATMVGQALGAGDPDRAERSVWIAGFLNLLYLAAAGVLFAGATTAVVRL